MSSLSTYEIRWDPTKPEDGAEMLGISPHERSVVTAKQIFDGDWLLVLHSKAHSWYGGTFSGTKYVPARYEIYQTIADLGNGVWEAKRLVEFPVTFKKEAK